MRIRRLKHAVSFQPPLKGMVTSLYAAEDLVPAGTNFGVRRLSKLTILLTESGYGAVRVKDRVGDRVATHQPGSLVLMARGLRFEEYAQPSSNWHVHYLMLGGPLATAINQRIWKSGGGLFVYDPAPPRWRRTFRECMELAFGQVSGWEWLFLGRLAYFSGELLRSPSPAGKPAGLFEQLRLLVERALEHDWRVEELAAALRTRPSTLAHSFKRHTGEALMQYVRRRRIEAASKLLQQGLSVIHTSERMGFANPYHFSRLFKQVTGRSPSTVRGKTMPSPLHPTEDGSG